MGAPFRTVVPSLIRQLDICIVVAGYEFRVVFTKLSANRYKQKLPDCFCVSRINENIDF